MDNPIFTIEKKSNSQYFKIIDNDFNRFNEKWCFFNSLHWNAEIEWMNFCTNQPHTTLTSLQMGYLILFTSCSTTHICLQMTAIPTPITKSKPTREAPTQISPMYVSLKFKFDIVGRTQKTKETRLTDPPLSPTQSWRTKRILRKLHKVEAGLMNASIPRGSG